jgi:hypothetical protein
MTWTYAKFIEKYGKDCIKETEEQFNAIIKAEKEKARLNGKQFHFNYLFFHFKFGENYEKMSIESYAKNPTVSASERRKNQGEKAKERAANPETSNVNTEDISITRLGEIINDTNLEFEEVGREGCFVDLAVHKKGSSRQTWFPVQMKASNAVIPKFNMNNRYNCPDKFKNTYERFNYYENMIVICHNVKIDEFLIIPPYSTKIPNTCLKYNSGVTKGYHVAKDDIIAKINEYIEQYSELYKPFSDIELLCSENKKLEIKYIRLRQKTFSEVFDMEEIDFCAVDFKIDEIVRVQEKTVNRRDNIENSFKFILEKNDGRYKTQYAIDDNDFYWLNLANTNYFYVIPSKLMEKDGNIRRTLTLHKEFKTEKENKTCRYTDTWTYGFRYDWTNPDDIRALWCIMNDFKKKHNKI